MSRANGGLYSHVFFVSSAELASYITCSVSQYPKPMTNAPCTCPTSISGFMLDTRKGQRKKKTTKKKKKKNKNKNKKKTEKNEARDECKDATRNFCV